jgi:AraC-like DNA-binding protein
MATFRGIGELPKRIFGCSRHRHETWEIVCYLEGTGTITVGDEDIPFTPGVVVCLPPRVPHHERSAGGYRNLHLQLADFVPPTDGVPRCRDDEHGTFRALAALLLREARAGGPDAGAIRQELAQVLVAYLQRWCRPDAASPLVERMKAMLHARYREPAFGIAQLLRGLGRSPEHARREFRAATGCSPLAYLTSLRIHEAQRLLGSGTRVGEVAERVGIPDPYYFSRVFSRRVGMSPSRWAEAVAAGSLPVGGAWTNGREAAPPDRPRG